MSYEPRQRLGQYSSVSNKKNTKRDAKKTFWPPAPIRRDAEKNILAPRKSSVTLKKHFAFWCKKMGKHEAPQAPLRGKNGKWRGNAAPQALLVSN